MSFSDVREYFRSNMESLDFKEHKDPFNTENISSNIIDRSFQLTNGSISLALASQSTMYSANVGMQLNVFYKGYNDVSGELDLAMDDIDIINAVILKASNRLGLGIKDVVPISVETLVLGPTNDTILVMQYNYTVKLLCNYN